MPKITFLLISFEFMVLIYYIYMLKNNDVPLFMYNINDAYQLGTFYFAEIISHITLLTLNFISLIKTVT